MRDTEVNSPDNTALTLFSWGYWGWGRATQQLIKAVDAVENSRDYQPPVFVDIRLSRSVRAEGFNGSAFERTVGASRYKWMDDLGNLGIKDGGPMRIKNPAAAGTLLDLAEQCHRRQQRVLFFCSCEFPGVEPKCCHRAVVARLLLEAAANRGRHIEVIEWPGGEPDANGIGFDVATDEMKKIRAGAKSIPLAEPVALSEMAAVPWLTLCGVADPEHEEEGELLVLTGPAKYSKAGWYLPIMGDVPDDVADAAISDWIRSLRERHGFGLRRTLV